MVIDPTLDSEVVQLEQTAVSAMYAKYKSRFGDHPSPEVEPSIDQLSALAQLLKGERHAIRGHVTVGSTRAQNAA